MGSCSRSCLRRCWNPAITSVSAALLGSSHCEGSLNYFFYTAFRFWKSFLPGKISHNGRRPRRFMASSAATRGLGAYCLRANAETLPLKAFHQTQYIGYNICVYKKVFASCMSPISVITKSTLEKKPLTAVREPFRGAARIEGAAGADKKIKKRQQTNKKKPQHLPNVTLNLHAIKTLPPCALFLA